MLLIKKAEVQEEISPQSIAKDLLSIGAVFLRPAQPFTWASGIQSPIYCDNRLTLSHPEVRQHVEQGLATLVSEKYPGCQLVAGTSTAGIAHAALVADLLNLPMCYVRATAKGHGRGNLIEGLAQAGQKVVVVEDLISTAGSVLDVVEVLRAAGCEVLGICSIFTYGLAAGEQRLAAAGVQNVSLSNYDALIEVALADGIIRQEDVKKLHAFRQNPKDTAWMDL